jgi:hypothetical protein
MLANPTIGNVCDILPPGLDHQHVAAAVERPRGSAVSFRDSLADGRWNELVVAGHDHE